MMKTFVRWALTVGMLVLVWLNAHWSVALAITFIAIRIELENILIERLKL